MSQDLEAQQSTQNTDLDCEIAVGAVVFDVICFFAGALGLRATVQRSVIKLVGQAVRPAVSKIEDAIAQLASGEATTIQKVSGVWEIARTIYRAGLLGAVVAAFRNTLTWWNALLYGVGAMASIIAALATDGAAFAAEVAFLIITATFFFTDVAKAVEVCKLTVKRPTYPTLPTGGKRKPHGGRVSILTRSHNFITVQNGGGVGTGSVFQTNRTEIGPWEKFTLVPIDPDAHTFALQTANGCFVTAEGGGGRGGVGQDIALQTNRATPGPWERLLLQHLADEAYSIVTDSLFYVTAVNGGGVADPSGLLPFKTNATEIGPDETFTLVGARDPTHLDLFMAGSDGTCWNILFEQATGWKSGWTAIQNTVKTTGGGPITSVYRDPTHLDLFMAGKDGTCWTISWDLATGWGSAWTAIQNTVKTTRGGPITAVYRDSTHLDLFMAGTDGTCWNISWDEATGWGSGWKAIQNTVKTTDGGPITAVYRDATHLDLFMASTDGTCWNISWDQATGWRSAWTAIQNTVKTKGGGPITAVYRDSTHLDLFMAGTDGTCRNISWDEATGWGSAWTAIQDTVKTRGGGPITAVYRDSNSSGSLYGGY